MRWWRMLRTALRLAGSDWLTPWRSPLLRWRMETYGVRDAQGRLLHAEEISPSRFVRFLCLRRGELWRFLQWAGRL